MTMTHSDISILACLCCHTMHIYRLRTHEIPLLFSFDVTMMIFFVWSITIVVDTYVNMCVVSEMCANAEHKYDLVKHSIRIWIISFHHMCLRVCMITVSIIIISKCYQLAALWCSYINQFRIIFLSLRIHSFHGVTPNGKWYESSWVRLLLS